MGIIYTTSDSKFTGTFDPYRYDGAQQYEKHFGNLMYLEFIAMNRLSTFTEKRQAESEIEIAKRKLKYWKRITESQGNSEALISAIQRVKKQWQSNRGN
jgi:hypothetical protein